VTVTLTEQHQRIAADLAQLLATFDACVEEAERSEVGVPEAEVAPVRQAVRVFGEQLNAEGGFDLMQAVGRRTQELTEAPRYLDFWWHGIGQWMA
jgi:hypothetical protein